MINPRIIINLDGEVGDDVQLGEFLLTESTPNDSSLRVFSGQLGVEINGDDIKISVLLSGWGTISISVYDDDRLIGLYTGTAKNCHTSMGMRMRNGAFIQIYYICE